MLMLIILIYVILGFCLGIIVKENYSSLNQKALNIWLICLLFVMGLSITMDESVITNLKSLGVAAFIVATMSVAGSIFALALINPFFKKAFDSTNNLEENQVKKSNSSFLILIFSALVLGAAGGLILPYTINSFLNGLVKYFLYLLLFSVGYDLYCNRHLLALVKKMGFKILLIPISIILGTLVFALPLFIFLPYNIGEIGALASGFGWYSLSSVIIGTGYCSTLGIVALLTNVFREVLAFVLTPLIPKFLPPITGLGPAGATAMDTLLPLISRSSGSGYAVPALISGIIISYSVSLLVPLFIEIARIF